MALTNAYLDEKQLGDLLKKGLEKDLINMVADHLITIARKDIDNIIVEKVTKIVRAYVNSVTSISREPMSGDVIIIVNLIDERKNTPPVS